MSIAICHFCMGDKTVKIITLNLLYGGLFFDNILSFFKKENPDILLLQEVYNGQGSSLPRNYRSIEVLTLQLPEFFYHFAPELLDHREEGIFEIGNAIFSRFPIIEDKTIFYDIPYDNQYVEAEKDGDFSKDPCNLQYVKIDHNGVFLNVFNTHGVWGFKGRDNERRFHMSDILVENIQNDENVILGGDFNTNPDTKSMQRLEKYLTNVFKGDLKSTFNMKHKTNLGYATAVVDMIYIDKKMKILDKRCPDVNVSDHFPLVVTIAV